MSRFRLALLAIGALAIAGALRLHRVRRSPVYSLQRLADAARAKDRRGVEQYLDVRRVAESVVDAAAESAGQEEGTRPLLVTAVEQSIWTTLTDSSLTRRYAGIADAEQRERVVEYAVSRVGQAFGYLDMLGTSLYLLTGQPLRWVRKHHETCSALVVRALQEGGLVRELDPVLTLPADLAKRFDVRA